MLSPMDSPRRSLSLGPITISIRREVHEDDVRRIGIAASFAVHAMIFILSIVLLRHEAKTPQLEVAKAPTPPVTVTFVNPLPPPVAAPKPAPKAQEPAFTMQKPPKPPTKPLRMEPAPEAIASLRNAPKDAPRKEAGRNDTRPLGGQAGGPLPKPTVGVPQEDGSVGREIVADRGTQTDEPKDLNGRLRDFQRALEAPRPPSPKGPKGGGSGTGGITMPQMPETGFGVGNLDFEGRDYDWADYGRQIYWEILRAWYRRLLADSGVFERWAGEKRRFMLDDTARVRFTITREGQVVDISVEGPSACYPLDDSAREALQEVVLPPLPEDFTRDSETVHARFIAEGDIRAMRGQLQSLHDYGWF
jgi:TonB family protein